MVIRSYGSRTSPSTRVEEHLGARHLQLEALAAHLFDEDGQLELAAPADLEAFGRLVRHHLDRDVAEDLPFEPRLDLAPGHVLPLAPAQRARVGAEGHAQRRLVDVESRQRARVGGIGERVADRDVGQARDRDDVAGVRLLDVDAFDAVRRRQAGNRAGQGCDAPRLHGTCRVVGLLAYHDDPLAEPDRPVPDPADGHAADVIVG